MYSQRHGGTLILYRKKKTASVSQTRVCTFARMCTHVKVHIAESLNEGLRGNHKRCSIFIPL